MKGEDQGVKETATHKRRNVEGKETAAVGKRNRKAWELFTKKKY